MLHISLEIIIIYKYGAFFVLEDDKTQRPGTGSHNNRRDYSEGMFHFSYIFLEHLQIIQLWCVKGGSGKGII